MVKLLKCVQKILIRRKLINYLFPGIVALILFDIYSNKNTLPLYVLIFGLAFIGTVLNHVLKEFIKGYDERLYHRLYFQYVKKTTIENNSLYIFLLSCSIIEEVFFRDYYFIRSTNLLTNASMFSLAHLSNIIMYIDYADFTYPILATMLQLLMTFLIGMVFYVAAYHFNCVYISIYLHIFYNFCVVKYNHHFIITDLSWIYKPTRFIYDNIYDNSYDVIPSENK